jgi:hypothetical protein
VFIELSDLKATYPVRAFGYGLLVLRRIRERRESRDFKLHIDAPQKNF